MPANAFLKVSKNELRVLNTAAGNGALSSLYLRILKFLMGQLSEVFAKSKRGVVLPETVHY